jgi:PEP-CTERM motif-containing protein
MDPAPTPGTVYVDNLRTIPEPATMVLLGLGGLLLRRKK